MCPLKRVNSTMPLDDRLRDGLLGVKASLGEINNRLTERAVPPEVAIHHTDESERVERLAKEVNRKLKAAADA